jgi:zinc protease
MANSLFDPVEAESERAVIINEREGSENSFAYLLSEEAQAAAFHAHAYRHPIIGWKSDLHSITVEELVRHYRAWYTPANAVAVAVGDFDAAAMLDAVKATFGALPPGSTPRMPIVTEPEQHAERRVVLHGGDPTAYLLLGFHVPGASHPDFFPLMVMDAVLGGAKGLGIAGGGGNNRSNRLYRALVESRLAVDASSGYRPTIDPELFSFFVTLAPDVRHETIEEVLWGVIERVQEEGVTAEEVAKAIKQTRAQFAFSSESVTFQAYWLGFAEVVADIQWLDTWPQRISEVTPADVQRVALEYFSRDTQTVGWYVPSDDHDRLYGLDDGGSESEAEGAADGEDDE